MTDLPTERSEGAPPLPPALSTLPLTISVRVGTTALSIRDLMTLGEGSLVALDARADAPLDVCVDDRVVARGELTETADGSLAVRLTETTA